LTAHNDNCLILPVLLRLAIVSVGLQLFKAKMPEKWLKVYMSLRSTFELGL